VLAPNVKQKEGMEIHIPTIGVQRRALETYSQIVDGAR